MFGSAANREILRERDRLTHHREGPVYATFGPSFPSPESMGMKWTGRNQDPTPVVYENLASAKDRILIFNQELEPAFFEEPVFQRFLRGKIEDGVRAEMIFSKSGTENFDQAVSILQQQNPRLLDLADSFPDRLQLYWVPRNISRQLLIVDDNLIMLAEPVRRKVDVFIEKKKEQIQRARAGFFGRIAIDWKAGFKTGLEADPLTDYSSIPFTETHFDNVKAVRNWTEHLHEIRDTLGIGIAARLICKPLVTIEI